MTVFPEPLITGPHPLYYPVCQCSWVWAEPITRNPENPFCIKRISAWCGHMAQHINEAYGKEDTDKIPWSRIKDTKS